MERGLAAAREIGPTVSVYQLELSSQKSVRACAEQLHNCLEKIDILVNNAGIMVGGKPSWSEATALEGPT